jgi:Rrf2 family protein
VYLKGSAEGDWVMLLTRKAWYGLIAVKHLAGRPGESSLSAKDLAELYGFPQAALAKILQRLAKAGVLLSHHGMKGGYTLARDPHQVSVLDVIRESERATRDGIHGKHWHDLESLPGYHQLRMVSQIVEDALHRVTIADIKEQASSPTDGEPLTGSYAPVTNAKHMV